MAFGRLAKWKRIAVSRLSVRYPSFLRFLPTARPLVIRQHPYHKGASPARDLLVCLPGIGDHAKDFEEWGFVDLVHAHPWAADVLLVDAHYGYYADRTILEQLHRDVLLPASGCGYRAIWLAGVSMGGLGALLYASRYQNDVRGVIAIAPFLGTHTLLNEITAAGGPALWISSIDPSDEIRTVWSWLASETRRRPAAPDIFLAFGESDTFVAAHHLLASCLPSTHVLVAPGGHRWPVWRQLWKDFLRRHIPRNLLDEQRQM
jgi:pimeloyl-ACP methyl ester carboxylesterase